MDDSVFQQWKGQLDSQRRTLSDPMAGVWSRVDRRKPLWIQASRWGAIAAAALLVIGFSWSRFAVPAENPWAPVLDDLWAPPSESADSPWLTDDSWNVLDLSDDHGA